MESERLRMNPEPRGSIRNGSRCSQDLSEWSQSGAGWGKSRGRLAARPREDRLLHRIRSRGGSFRKRRRRRLLLPGVAAERLDPELDQLLAVLAVNGASSGPDEVHQRIALHDLLIELPRDLLLGRGDSRLLRGEEAGPLRFGPQRGEAYLQLRLAPGGHRRVHLVPTVHRVHVQPISTHLEPPSPLGEDSRRRNWPRATSCNVHTVDGLPAFVKGGSLDFGLSTASYPHLGSCWTALEAEELLLPELPSCQSKCQVIVLGA